MNSFTLNRIAATFLAATAAVPSLAAHQSPEPVRIGAFVDAYFAWDGARPRTLDRPYTTQPARHAEFNVNLAFLDVNLARGPIRGRVALQAGTAVQANYAGEPRIGSVSGPDLSRHIQEATLGVRVASSLWLDAGVFFSHIGQESWISSANPTYTRSLIADYTPYYSTGVRAAWQATPALAVQVHLVNGWQIISETNADKSGGVRLEYAPRAGVLLGYSNFIGNEQPDSVEARVRVFNQVFARVGDPEGTAAWLTADYGVQEAVDGGTDGWYGVALIGRHALTERVAVSGRLERYADPDQVIVARLGTGGFETTGGSLGLDVAPGENLLWRSEVRAFRGDRPLYPAREVGLERNAWLVVTSLALTL